MTGSLRTHGGLTEPSRETMSGKGREGNKEGKGRRVETSHHGVQLLEATAPDEMMALRAIEHLDFDHTPPCEHDWHNRTHVADQFASWHITVQCPSCPNRDSYLICDSGLKRLLSLQVLVCTRCSIQATSAADFLVEVRAIR